MMSYYDYKDFYRQRANDSNFNAIASIEAGTFDEDYPVILADIPELAEATYQNYMEAASLSGEEPRPDALNAIEKQMEQFVDLV